MVMISACEQCEVCKRFIMKVLSLAPQQVPLCCSSLSISKQHEAPQQPLDRKQAAQCTKKENNIPTITLTGARHALLTSTPLSKVVWNLKVDKRKYTA